MKKVDILTVIIRTYNHGKTIKKAIESVLEQKTLYQYKIWICEDCSTDNTLKICNEYANKYPDKIKLIAQPVNTKRSHSYAAISKIKTKYYAILDGDDYWCKKEKIQIAIDILETHPQYVMFAHDTLYNDIPNKTKKALVKDILKIKIQNPINLYSAPYLHLSSRIYKNVINYRDFFKNPITRGDLISFYLMLDKGPLYYYDKVMSVYNITGTGIWSKLSKRQQINTNEILYYNINKLLKYKYDAFFSEKIQKVKILKIFKNIFGLKFGWKFYILYMKICFKINSK